MDNNPMIYEDLVDCEECGAAIAHLVCGRLDTSGPDYYTCVSCIAKRAPAPVCGAPLDNRVDLPAITCELDPGHEGDVHQCGGWFWPVEPVKPAAVELAPAMATGFAEPWKMDQDTDSPTCGHVLDARGVIVVDPWGSTLDVELEEARYMRRIAACVNACRGTSTEELEDGGTFTVLLGNGFAGWLAQVAREALRQQERVLWSHQKRLPGGDEPLIEQKTEAGL